jgi:predicted esterase
MISRSSLLLIALAALVAMFACLPAMAQEAAAPDFSALVEGVNPMQADAGDFLDTDITALAKQANELYQGGSYEEAAKYFLALLRFNISDGGAIYNLACCYGLMGDGALAAKYLKRAAKAGMTDIGWVKDDSDFAKVRETPEFAEAITAMEDEYKAKQAELGEFVAVRSEGYYSCRVFLPPGFNADEEHTLILGLHGYGDTNENFIKLHKRMGDPDLIFAAPQGQYPFLDGKDIGYSWLFGNESDEALFGNTRIAAVEHVASAIAALKAKYKVDKVYLLGFSQGCAMAYYSGFAHPELVSGIICFGGWLDTEVITPEVRAAAKGLRVFIAHGTKDPVVEYKNGEDARDVLTAEGFDVTFASFDGPHAVPEAPLKQAVAWVLAG